VTVHVEEYVVSYHVGCKHDRRLVAARVDAHDDCVAVALAVYAEAWWA